MNFKKSLLIALFSLGIAHSAFAEIDERQADLQLVEYLQQRNIEAIYSFLKQLAEQGNAKYQTTLGLMYKEGKGIPKNTQQAIYWLKKAAEQGRADAQLQLGGIYLTEQEVRDPKKSLYWLEKAATQGEVRAYYGIGIIYATKQDFDKASYYYRLACNSGIKEACEAFK